MPSNSEHLERAVEMILGTGKGSIAMLGLSFKAGTDDLRESPHVRVAKRLLGEGRRIRVWDPNVALGRLVGSNRQYVEEAIPHIGALFCSSLEEAIDGAEVVVVGTREVSIDSLQRSLTQEQVVIDLVNLENGHRQCTRSSYAGVCW